MNLQNNIRKTDIFMIVQFPVQKIQCTFSLKFSFVMFRTILKLSSYFIAYYL